MRQVPTHYLIIGDGRLALHFKHYLTLLNLSFDHWARRFDAEAEQLASKIQNATHVLLLISDRNIEAFIQEHVFLQEQILVHCSGSLYTPLAWGAHPLMTFNTSLYNLAVYQEIPFILDENAPDFAGLLPGLPNIHYRIPNQLKAFYHSLCVMSGNFTCLLWQKFFAELEQKFNLPRSVAFPYLNRIANNLQHLSEAALTGPLVRNDHLTITANLQSLSGDSFKKIYQAFVDIFVEDKEHE